MIKKFNSVQDLLDKFETHDKVPKDLFKHFDTELTNQNKLKYRIPVNKIITN